MKLGATVAYSLALGLLVSSPASIAGRPVAIWQTDRLWKEADVVVIAEAEVIDGPAFVSFDTRGKAAYLLFLRAPKADQASAATEFEPITGQMDPGRSFSRLVPVER